MVAPCSLLIQAEFPVRELEVAAESSTVMTSKLKAPRLCCKVGGHCIYLCLDLEVGSSLMRSTNMYWCSLGAAVYEWLHEYSFSLLTCS